MRSDAMSEYIRIFIIIIFFRFFLTHPLCFLKRMQSHKLSRHWYKCVLLLYNTDQRFTNPVISIDIFLFFFFRSAFLLSSVHLLLDVVRCAEGEGRIRVHE